MSTTITAGNATNNGASIASDTAGTIQIQTGSTPTTAITIDGSQNVGIGTTSPAKKLDVAGDFKIGTGTAAIVTFNGSSYGQIVSSPSLYYDADAQYFRTGSGNAERMRIDSSGNLLVGKTGSAEAGVGLVFGASGFARFTVSGTAAATMAQFNNNSGTTVGRIETSGSSTSYITSSDYRLKEGVTPMQGALAKVSALNPVTYKWKSDGSYGEGFIAHELAEVAPNCVYGKKDAVDEEGNPVYQGIDTSFLVATLTAAIQEQQTMIEELKTKVAALEAK